MIAYYVHWHYPITADNELFYSGEDNKLFHHKENAEKYAKDKIDEWNKASVRFEYLNNKDDNYGLSLEESEEYRRLVSLLDGDLPDDYTICKRDIKFEDEMIQNIITKVQAYAVAMNFIEKEYKLDIEEIYDHIKRAANNGKFYCRYYISDDTKTHSLTYYFKNQGYSCNSNYDYKKDENNKVIYDEDGAPIKDKIWIDIFWSL